MCGLTQTRHDPPAQAATGTGALYVTANMKRPCVSCVYVRVEYYDGTEVMQACIVIARDLSCTYIITKSLDRVATVRCIKSHKCRSSAVVHACIGPG